MKICHFVASVGLGRGDVFVDLCNALSETEDIWLVAPKGAKFKVALRDNVSLVEYRSRNSRFNPLLIWELFLIFRKISPDVVHAHFGKAAAIFQLLNKLLKVPWVATKHNPRRGRIYSRIDNVIAVSEGVAASIKHKRVTVIYNGINPIEIVNNEAPEADSRREFIILVVGRLEKIKAFDRLIEECAKLDFSYKLRIVGDGPEKENLLALATSLGISDRVEFLGFRTDVPALMGNSDVIVVSSHSEGFSLVIAEALHYGNVLISRDVGIAGKVLPAEFIVKDYGFSSSLMQVFANYEKYKKVFTEVKVTQAHNYNMENTVLQHLRVYKELNV